MSVGNLLRDSGLFREYPQQPSTGSTCFQIIGGDDGASIYALRNDREVHIRVRAFERGRFRNINDRLHDFVYSNSHGTVRQPSNAAHAYKLYGRYMPEVIEIIRSGA